MTKSSKVPATERVLEYIISEMDAGTLAPGSRINAARIAANLELSAAPVREALCVLAGRGIIELAPDRGAIMRSLGAEDILNIWKVLTPVAAIGLSEAATAIADGADTSGLVAAYERIVTDPGSDGPYQFLMTLNEWHYEANSLSGNPYVTHTFVSLGLDYWDRYLVQYIDVGGNIEKYLNTYARLNDALMAGDPLGATGVIEYHAQWSMEKIRQFADAQPKARRRRSKIKAV